MESINRVHQWATDNVSDTDILGEVARFVLVVTNHTSLTADRLSAIQRKCEPIDDSGTMRDSFNRCDVETLLREVLRLRAEVAGFRPEGTKECKDHAAPAAIENVAPSEQESPATTVSDTSDVVTVPIVLPE